MTPTHKTLHRQLGISLSGIMFFMILVGLGAYSAARVLPGYFDYWAVQRVMKNILQQPDIQDAKERVIRDRFVKELRINNIDTVNSEDLLVEWVPDGVRLSVAFSVKKPFMGPVSLCMDFQAEATSN